MSSNALQTDKGLLCYYKVYVHWSDSAESLQNPMTVKA